MIHPNRLRLIVQFGLMTLRERDHQLILKGQWLNDEIINAVQSLLKHQFQIPGLQSVCAIQTLTIDIEHEEFVQILHNGSNHWLTISTIGAEEGEVFLYDLMYCNANSTIKNGVSALLFTNKKRISLKFANVQMQSGGADCGVFASAYATALCLGLRPERFSFNQELMRSHLLECLEKQKMSSFPVQRERRRSAKFPVKSEHCFPIFCSCRLPALPNVSMIQCRKCKEWYHIGACVSVPAEILVIKKAQWKCSCC